VHWSTSHHDDLFHFRHRDITGAQLAEEIRADLTEALTGESDFNRVFTQNGIACTTASLIAATQQKKTLDEIVEADVPAIRDAHLLLAKYNAWQPGVFALSGWDLTGSLTVPSSEVHELIATGDTRWIERGAHDLIDAAPGQERSAAGMPKARSLYGSLQSQLADPESFASGLRSTLGTRERYGISRATQVDIPHVAHPSMLVMVHRLDNGDAADENAQTQITVLNFSGEPIDGTVRSDALPSQADVIDTASGESVGRVDDLQSFSVSLPAYGGLFLVLEPAEIIL